MDVGARTDGLSCSGNVLVLQTQPGKKKNKVTTGVGWRGHPTLPAKDLLSLREREVDERGVGGKGADGREGRFAAVLLLLKSTHCGSQGMR